MTTPCRVEWCVALAAHRNGFCLVHRQHPRLQPRTPQDHEREAHFATVPPPPFPPVPWDEALPFWEWPR